MTDDILYESDIDISDSLIMQAMESLVSEFMSESGSMHPDHIAVRFSSEFTKWLKEREGKE